MLFDTHTHLNDQKFAKDLPEVMNRAEKAGVSTMAVVGCDLPSSYRAVQLARKHKNLYAVVGVHPHDAETLYHESILRLKLLAQEPKVIAIGEIGLDYYYDKAPREIQKQAFISQIRLAASLQKPIVVHDRDAHQDVFDILNQEAKNKITGILHCYSGSLEMAEAYMEMGFYISFAGPVTFKNAGKLRKVVAGVPLEKILVETDCPYLAPEPKRGKRNEPANVRYTAEKIAEIKGLDNQVVEDKTYENAKSVFGLEI